MALQGLWMQPFSVPAETQAQVVTIKTPAKGIPPNAGVVSYVVLHGSWEYDDISYIRSWIDSFVQNGSTSSGPFPAITPKGTGVSEVTAVGYAYMNYAEFLFVTEIFE